MEVKLEPEQPDEVRAAIAAALERERALVEPPSEWWRSGVRENVEAEEA